MIEVDHNLCLRGLAGILLENRLSGRRHRVTLRGFTKAYTRVDG